MSADKPKERASMFGDVDELPKADVSRFQPKPRPESPDKDVVRAISEANKFPSRQPVPPTPEPEVKRARRVHRTGRNVQFNIKASQDAIDRFYRLNDDHGWVLGETFEHAVKALELRLAEAKREN